MVEKHHQQPQQQHSSAGVQQPDHALVNLLENRGRIPGRGRGDERGKDGTYRKCSGHWSISGAFSDPCIHTRTNWEHSNSEGTRRTSLSHTCPGAC